MNADAIVFNLRRWWDKADPYGFRDQGRTFEIVGDLLGGFKGDPTAVIKNIVKVDNMTVRVDLNKPSSVLPNVLAAGYFGIASPTAIKKDGAKYGTPASKALASNRRWGTGAIIADPAHILAARRQREAFQTPRAAPPGAGEVVVRDLADYDTAFGVNIEVAS